MLHRKQYRVAVRVTIMVLALTLTACGTQENTGSTESVKSTETVENTETVKGTETVESTETIENVEIIEAMVSESAAPQGTANVTPQMQPVEYTNLQQITLDSTWEYADHSKINTGAAVLYLASEESGCKGIVIGVNVRDADIQQVVANIQETLNKNIKLKPGYYFEYGGQFESEESASRVLLLTSFISIVVIFLLLYFQFRNAAQSGVILLNLPLALIGGVFALLLTTGEISIPAIIGFISLFGIATRNGMLLISHYNHLQKEEGLNVYDSVIRGSLDRLNPILMTALSSALALIPLALGGDLPGNEIQSPMAKVILGGLLTSTFLNGFIVPIVYLMMHRKKAQESL